jgi:hypothetical protein
MSFKGHTHSEETKERMRQAMANAKLDAALRAQICGPKSKKATPHHQVVPRDCAPSAGSASTSPVNRGGDKISGPVNRGGGIV